MTFQNGVMVNLKKGLQCNGFNSSKTWVWICHRISTICIRWGSSPCSPESSQLRFLVSHNIQESRVRYRGSKDSPLNFQYSLLTVLEMGYGQLLGKTAVKLLLIILPCHAFKLNIFWVTYNEELKPLEGISETRYTEKNYLLRCITAVVLITVQKS